MVRCDNTGLLIFAEANEFWISLKFILKMIISLLSFRLVIIIISKNLILVNEHKLFVIFVIKLKLETGILILKVSQFLDFKLSSGFIFLVDDYLRYLKFILDKSFSERHSNFFVIAGGSDIEDLNIFLTLRRNLHLLSWQESILVVNCQVSFLRHAI